MAQPLIASRFVVRFVQSAEYTRRHPYLVLFRYQ